MRSEDARFLHYLCLGILFVFGLWFIYAVRDILTLFLLAAIVAYALDPLLDRLERDGWSRGRAAAIVFLVCTMMFVITLFALLPTLERQVESLSANYVAYGKHLTETSEALRSRLSGRFPQLKTTIEQGQAQIGRASCRERV